MFRRKFREMFMILLGKSLFHNKFTSAIYTFKLSGPPNGRLYYKTPKCYIYYNFSFRSLLRSIWPFLMCTGLKFLMKKFLKLQRWLTATERYKDTEMTSLLIIETWFRLVVMSFFGTSRSLRCTANLKHMMGGQICFGRRKLILLLTFLIEIRMESLPGRNWHLLFIKNLLSGKCDP